MAMARPATEKKESKVSLIRRYTSVYPALRPIDLCEKLQEDYPNLSFGKSEVANNRKRYLETITKGHPRKAVKAFAKNADFVGYLPGIEKAAFTTNQIRELRGRVIYKTDAVSSVADTVRRLKAVAKDCGGVDTTIEILQLLKETNV